MNTTANYCKFRSTFRTLWLTIFNGMMMSFTEGGLYEPKMWPRQIVRMAIVHGSLDFYRRSGFCPDL